MTMLRPVIRLRRERLLAALRSLPVEETAVLLLLATQACPTTGRVWTSALRIADELNVPRLPNGLEAPPVLIETLLTRLERRGHLRSLPSRFGIRTLELGPVFVRDVEAPENLPVAPDL